MNAEPSHQLPVCLRPAVRRTDDGPGDESAQSGQVGQPVERGRSPAGQRHVAENRKDDRKSESHNRQTSGGRLGKDSRRLSSQGQSV